MKRGMNAALVAAFVLGGAASAFAQAPVNVYGDSTKGVASTPAPSPAVSDTKATVTLAEPVALSKIDRSVPVQASFGEIVKADGTRRSIPGLEKVKIDGVIAVSPEAKIAEGKTLSAQEARRYGGTITWNALSVPKADVVRRASLPSPLVSRIKERRETLSAGYAVQAEGDVPGALALAENLLKDEGAKSEDTAGKKQPGGSDSAKSDKPALGGERTGNNLAQLRQLPTTTAATTEAASPTIGTTQDGCGIEVDRTAGAVYKTNRKSVNGVGEGECSRSGESIKIERSWCAGQDKVDMTAKAAYPTYKDYYLLDGTAQYLDADCVADITQKFDFQADTTKCSMQLDFGTLKAQEQAETFYLDRLNSRVKVSDCAPTTTAAVAITYTDDGCGLRHDYTAGKSWQQRRAVYTWQNEIKSAGQCSDDPARSYAHTTVTCPDVVSLTDMSAFSASKKQITTDAGAVDVTACTPSTTSMAITSTTDTCQGTYYHYLDSGQSFGSERFAYIKNGIRTFATECQQSTVTFAHKTRTTSYENHDNLKLGYPLTEIYIETPTGDVVVSSAQVRSGAVGKPYVYLSRSLINTGENEYIPENSCDKYQKTEIRDSFTRPDGSSYQETVGPGTPVGPSYSCTASGGTNVSDWVKIADRVATDAGGTWLNYYVGDYRATRTIKREDGRVISTDTATRPNNNSYGYGCYSGVNYHGLCGYQCGNSSCPTNPGATAVSSWRAELGW